MPSLTTTQYIGAGIPCRRAVSTREYKWLFSFFRTEFIVTNGTTRATATYVLTRTLPCCPRTKSNTEHKETRYFLVQISLDKKIKNDLILLANLRFYSFYNGIVEGFSKCRTRNWKCPSAFGEGLSRENTWPTRQGKKSYSGQLFSGGQQEGLFVRESWTRNLLNKRPYIGWWDLLELKTLE